MATNIDLHFTLTDCTGCGAHVPVALGCTECDATEARDDPHVMARRRLIETARLRVVDIDVAPTQVPPKQLLNDLLLAGIVDTHLRLLSTIDTPDAQWSHGYSDNLQRFRDIQERALTSTRRDEFALASDWIRLDEILMRTASAVEGFERSATALTVQRAQRVAAEAQRQLDAVSR